LDFATFGSTKLHLSYANGAATALIYDDNVTRLLAESVIYYGVLAQLGSEESRIMTGSTILMPSLRGAITLLRATMRVEVLHGEYFAALQSRGVPILLALWHGRMFLVVDAHRRQGFVTMASKSKDGDIIAGWLENNGYVVVRGSTTRGGSEALRRMVYHMRAINKTTEEVDKIAGICPPG
jgi:hypothetical protein